MCLSTNVTGDYDIEDFKTASAIIYNIGYVEITTSADPNLYGDRRKLASP